MSSTETTFDGAETGAASARTKLACRIVSARLRRLSAGSIKVTLPCGGFVHHMGQKPGPAAELHVHRWRALPRIAIDGELGLARAYMDCDCSSPDIKALLAFGEANGGALRHALPKTPLARFADRLHHWRRSNTRRGSRRNIAAHYDLGNEFYRRWLDRGMNYSSGIYDAPDRELEDAQTAKLERIAALLDVKPGHRVLEIGCGWGALAEHLVDRHGCAVTGLTLSAEQKAYADARLGPAAEFRLQDYRDLGGVYDRVASIEMLEAVGERYWPTYFHKLRHSLSGSGVAVLQVITIAEARYAAYRRQPDFIQRFIFPGGMLPTAAIVRRQAEQVGLRVVSHETFGQSYAWTLAEWRRRFVRSWPVLSGMGFDTRFKRMWEYYLAYCEVGFDRGAIDVGLFKLTPAPLR